MGTTTTVIAELDNIEEIVISGQGGGDTFIPNGNFTGTSLSTSTITIEGGAGDDTVDISALQSAHRIVFRSNGGNDTIVGNLRPQDVIELPAGADPADYTPTANDNGTTTLSNGIHSITVTGTTVPNLVPVLAPDGGSGAPGSGGPQLDEEDLEDLLGMVQSGLVRDSSGDGNNEANPNWGTAGHNFIRLTDAHYTDGAAGIRQTELTPREISDILANQNNDGIGGEESIPNAVRRHLPPHLLRPVFRPRARFRGQGSSRLGRDRFRQLPHERAAVEHRARHRR